MEGGNSENLFKQILTNPRGGRRLAISDVHGFADTLQELVTRKIKLAPEDQLFLLGDYIDRGKGNARVLDLIMNLQERGFQVFPLRGNHEQMLLDAWNEYLSEKDRGSNIRFHAMIEAIDLIDDRGNLAEKYLQFVDSLPYYYELDRFYLVHAGFNFHEPNPLADYESMLWMWNFTRNPTAKTVVHGHITTDLVAIRQTIQTKHSIICIDNGCYYGLSLRNIQQYNPLFTIDKGNLCALDLDSYELFVQKNIG